MSTTNWKEIVVRKPWGYEYLLYQNPAVAVWLLHLQEGGRTSMHCHPKKKTGLILLSGEAEISFLTDSMLLTAPSKCMLRAGLFHSTEALSAGGVTVLELESPPDKEDLVRLEDTYGRKATPYEGNASYIPRESFETFARWIEDPAVSSVQYVLDGGAFISLRYIRDKEALASFPANTILAVLRGGLLSSQGPSGSPILTPGDVISGKTAARLAQEFAIIPDTLLLLVGA